MSDSVSGSGLRWSLPPRWDALPPQRVTFVVDRAAEAAADEWQRMGQPRVLAVGTNPRRIDGVARNIPRASRWAEAEMHVPREAADRATDAARSAGAELLMAVGGGSAVGFSKWIAHELELPIIAVPTTLAGSEATTSFGVTEDDDKHVHESPGVLPRSVIYDGGLLASLPQATRVESAYNALAHAVDSLWTIRTTETLRDAALAAVAQMRLVSPNARRTPTGGDAQMAAYEAALVFAAAGSGVHHKICHVLGGRFALPHAAAHAAVLPYVAILSAARDAATGQRLATALASSTVEKGFTALQREWGTPAPLREIGLTESAIDDVVFHVKAALKPSYESRFTTAELTLLITGAWAGERLDAFERSVR